MTALDVASILCTFTKENKQEISHKQLYMLMYFAQGSYLGYFKQSLFNEDIIKEAPYPIIKSIQQQFKEDTLLFPIDSLVGHGISTFQQVDAYTKMFFMDFWNQFGKLTISHLMLVLQEQECFINTVNNQVIDKEYMKHCFTITRKD